MKKTLFSLFAIFLCSCPVWTQIQNNLDKKYYTDSSFTMLYSGTLIDVNGKGDTLSVVEYQNGVKSGYFKEFNKNGKVLQTGKIIDGELYGEYTSYYDDGAIYEHLFFKNGIKDSLNISYLRNGEVMSLEYFIDGKLNGESLFRQPDGTLSYRANFVNGVKHGKLEDYHPNGMLYIETNYVDGLLDGQYKEYDRQGVLIKESVYKDGKEIIDTDLVFNEAEKFLNTMKLGNDVRGFISNEYIVSHKLEDGDWQCNYYLIKKFKIVSTDEMTATVQIDHGAGAFCTEFKLEFILEDSRLKIKPNSVKFSPKIKRNIVTPWKDVKKLCPQ